MKMLMVENMKKTDQRNVVMKRKGAIFVLCSFLTCCGLVNWVDFKKVNSSFSTWTTARDKYSLG